MKIKNIILTTAFALTLSVFTLQPAINSFAYNQDCIVEQYEDSTVTPRSDYKEWVYKTENGKLYKRLYNASADTWETDWIYVCEYPGEL